MGINRMMVLKGNSPAIHKLGDIRRDEDDLIRVWEEEGEYYIGCFEEGFGFVNVRFNKNDCRCLTPKEIADMNGRWYSINNTPLHRIYLDKDGNFVSGKG